VASATTQAPIVFYVVFGLLLTAAFLTLALFVTGQRRRRFNAANDGRAPVLEGIRLVVVSGRRHRSPVNRLRRSTQTTTPTARTHDIAEAPGPDTTGNEAS